MSWLLIATQITTVLTAVGGATWFIIHQVIRQNERIAAGILSVKENDLRHIHEKLDALHVDTHAITEKLDRHLEWHLTQP